MAAHIISIFLFYVFSRGLLVISTSLLRVDSHMTFQTSWMAEQLLSRDENNRVYSGGLLSDVTYKFFRNGYLLSTSMYHEDLRRWIPILLTWLKGLTENHYAAHFSTLMRQIKNAYISEKECDILVRQVVDFSLAQKNGFILAYMDIFGEKDRAVALSKLQGCHEHFRAQVTRVKRNRAIIPAEKEVRSYFTLHLNMIDLDVDINSVCRILQTHLPRRETGGFSTTSVLTFERRPNGWPDLRRQNGEDAQRLS